MKPMPILLVLLALATGFGSSPALAQTTNGTPSPMAKARSPQSLECSKEADAKGLHGAARKKFRKDCMKKATGGMNKQDVD